MDVREVANYLLNHCFLPSQAEDLLEKHYYAVNHLEELRRIFKPPWLYGCLPFRASEGDRTGQRV